MGDIVAQRLVLQRSQPPDQSMLRVDLQDRLGGGIEPAGRSQQLLELAVRPAIGRDKADRAVGQAVGGADVGDLVAERGLERLDEAR